MGEPTEKQLNAAHDAWEAVSSQWRLRKVSNYGLADDVWSLESVPSATFNPGRDYANEIVYHKFHGADAERDARWMLRDKIVKAVCTAIQVAE